MLKINVIVAMHFGLALEFKNIIMSYSPFQDDFFVLHVVNDYDSVMESIFKTEFLHVLSKKYEDKMKKKLHINFQEKYVVLYFMAD